MWPSWLKTTLSEKTFYRHVYLMIKLQLVSHNSIGPYENIVTYILCTGKFFVTKWRDHSTTPKGWIHLIDEIQFSVYCGCCKVAVSAIITTISKSYLFSWSNFHVNLQQYLFCCFISTKSTHSIPKTDLSIYLWFIPWHSKWWLLVTETVWIVHFIWLSNDQYSYY